MKKPEYLEEVNETTDSLDELKKKVEFYQEITNEIKEIETTLKNKKELLNQVSQQDIPNLVLSRGLSRLKLDTGETVEVKENISVSIKDEEEFFKFLEQREEDDIIKTIVSLDRMPSNMLKKLFNFLDEGDYPYTAKKGVHAKTREKYFKELLGIGLTEEVRKKRIEEGLCIRLEALPNFVNVWQYYKTRIK